MPRAEPKYQKPRYACPFYGFVRRNKRVVPGDKNGCCLNSGKLCIMKAMRKIPCWKNCGFKIKANSRKISKLALECNVFPEEFSNGLTSWNGISFKTWLQYVMSDKTPRPGG